MSQSRNGESMSTKRPDSIEEFRRKQKAKRGVVTPPPSHNAPESANLSADELPIVEAGRTAMQSLRKTFELWTTVGRAMETLRSRADRLGGRQTFQRLLDQQGFGDLDKATVARLLRIMERLLDVVAWHETLTAKQKREWASPSAVFKHCPVFAKPKQSREPKPTLRGSVTELSEENAALKAYVVELEAAREAGPRAALPDDVDAVAALIVDTFPPDKAVRIAGRVVDKLKQMQGRTAIAASVSRTATAASRKRKIRTKPDAPGAKTLNQLGG
jgi:hypothetical protein